MDCRLLEASRVSDILGASLGGPCRLSGGKRTSSVSRISRYDRRQMHHEVRVHLGAHRYLPDVDIEVDSRLDRNSTGATTTSLRSHYGRPNVPYIMPFVLTMNLFMAVLLLLMSSRMVKSGLGAQTDYPNPERCHERFMDSLAFAMIIERLFQYVFSNVVRLLCLP